MADVADDIKGKQDGEAPGVFANKAAFAVSELALRTEFTNLLSIKDLLSRLEQIIIGLGNMFTQTYFSTIDRNAIKITMASIEDVLAQPSYGKVDFVELPIFNLSKIVTSLDLLRKDCTNIESRRGVLSQIKEQNDVIDAQLVEIGRRMDALKDMLRTLPGGESILLPKALGFMYVNRGDVSLDDKAQKRREQLPAPVVSSGSEQHVELIVETLGELPKQVKMKKRPL